MEFHDDEHAYGDHDEYGAHHHDGTFVNIPDEVLRHVLRYTDIQTALTVSRCCRRLRHLVWGCGSGVFLSILAQHLGLSEEAVAAGLPHRRTEADWALELQLLDETPSVAVFQERFHDDEVMTALWSPDGKLLASSSKDGSVRVYRLERGGSPGARTFALRLAAAMPVTPGRHARSTAWSPDGTMLMATDFDESQGFSSIHVWGVPDSWEALAAAGLEQAMSELSSEEQPLLKPAGTPEMPKLLEVATSRFDTCMWTPRNEVLHSIIFHSNSGAAVDVMAVIDPTRPANTGLHYGTFHYTSTAAVRAIQLVRGDLRPRDYDASRTVAGLPGNPVFRTAGPPEFSLIFTRGSTENDIDELMCTPYGAVEQRPLAHFDGQISGMAVSRDDRYALLNVRPFPPGRAALTAALRARRERLGPRASATEVMADPSIDLGNDWCPVADGPPRLVLFDLREARTARVLQGRAAFSKPPFILLPDFQGSRPFVACGSEDGTVWVWHRDTGAPARVLRLHSNCVNQVHFNPADPRLLAACSDDFTLSLFYPAHLADPRGIVRGKEREPAAGQAGAGASPPASPAPGAS